MRQERAERTRRALVLAAAQAFDAHGYDRTSLQSISGSARVTKGGLGFHFASKRELALAVRDSACASARSALASLERGERPALQVAVDMTHALVQQLHRSPVARAAVRLTQHGDLPDDETRDYCLIWRAGMDGALTRAVRQRALTQDSDPGKLAPLALALATGAELTTRPLRSRGHGTAVATACSPDVPPREWLGLFWRLVLPQLATPTVLPEIEPMGSLR
ncbi:TetR/AcrR family transcriptional regulator [Streptomyces sp. AJS327]|uniref:TetR/AcrR family transcriptional regulator n=1 Tax=Streptomyces sp. AJS327 TaxID=2545265 RepID=UPI0015DEC1FE|nr:TetR/AcrR family transcriptional regulator [Streptomyces sp. AJS327]MBA0049637.1 TetR/AcrR family transcriptional regulator [Streptomyces sp. AJS327]